MPEEPKQLTVYFDGSCPLCHTEIEHYRAQDGADAICFLDISKPDVVIESDITRQQAMARFHVRPAGGQLLSGAAAFVSVWTLLPRWRWLARIAGIPGVLMLLEFGYRLFLPIRPVISRIFGRFKKWSDADKAAHNGDVL